MKFLKVFISVVLIIALFFVVINLIPPKQAVEDNPFISTIGRPLIAAHRGGKDLSPENTLLAYDNALNRYHMEIVETDSYLTKDNVLVINHDSSINRTTDVMIRDDIELDKIDDIYYYKGEIYNGAYDMYNGKAYKRVLVEDKTLEELKAYNFGFRFESLAVAEGFEQQYPVGVRAFEYITHIADEAERKAKIVEEKVGVLTVDELFEYFHLSAPDLLYIVEIKNSGERGKIAADILSNLLTNTYPTLKNKVSLCTFHPEIEDYLKEKYPTILRGASTKGATMFVLTTMLGVNLFENSGFACLQIPIQEKIPGTNMKLNLVKKIYIKRAQRKNIAAQYWTINDEEMMRKLIEFNVDCIMTDCPDLLYKVLKDMNKIE